MAERLELTEEALAPGQSEHSVWGCKWGAKAPSTGL